MSEFKGTKGKWEKNGLSSIHQNNSIQTIYISGGDNLEDIAQANGYPRSNEEVVSNAQLIVDAGSVRQKINCSLLELLEQRNELLQALKHEVSLLNDARQRTGVTDKEMRRHQRMSKAIEKATKTS